MTSAYIRFVQRVRIQKYNTLPTIYIIIVIKLDENTNFKIRLVYYYIQDKTSSEPFCVGF